MSPQTNGAGFHTSKRRFLHDGWTAVTNNVTLHNKRWKDEKISYLYVLTLVGSLLIDDLAHKNKINERRSNKIGTRMSDERIERLVLVYMQQNL